jgi:hypothetical protein
MEAKRILEKLNATKSDKEYIEKLEKLNRKDFDKVLKEIGKFAKGGER